MAHEQQYVIRQIGGSALSPRSKARALMMARQGCDPARVHHDSMAAAVEDFQAVRAEWRNWPTNSGSLWNRDTLESYRADLINDHILLGLPAPAAILKKT